MQQAKKLVLIDEFDREYKRLQRPADAVAKTGKSLHLSDTLRESSLDDDRKMKGYVAALHRYLNVRKELPPQPITDDVRSPGSFGGIHNLKRYSGRSEREVKTFLSGRDAYTLHKPRRIRFPRHKTYSKCIADLYQIDLVDMPNISSYHDAVRYLLAYIDVFSKKAWAVPVRTKTGREVAKAFEKNLLDDTHNMVQSVTFRDLTLLDTANLCPAVLIMNFLFVDYDVWFCMLVHFRRSLFERC